jgi:hypothetical protein
LISIALTMLHAGKRAAAMLLDGVDASTLVVLDEVLGVPEAVKLDLLPVGCLPNPVTPCFTVEELASHAATHDAEQTVRYRATVSMYGVSQQVDYQTLPNASLAAQALAFLQALSDKADVQILTV